MKYLIPVVGIWKALLNDSSTYGAEILVLVVWYNLALFGSLIVGIVNLFS